MKVKSVGLLLAFTLAVSVFSTRTALADDDSTEINEQQEQREYLSQLEANVDLTKPLDNSYSYRYFLFDQNGKLLKQLKYNSVMPFSEGLASVTDHHPKFIYANGYIDTAGQLVIPVQFANGYNFSEGLAYAISDDGKGGAYINASAKIVIANKNLYFGQEFSEGMAAVRMRVIAGEVDNGQISGPGTPGKYGFMDKQGNVVIAPQYDDARSFKQGCAAVQKSSKWFFINAKGKQLGGAFDKVDSFSDGMAAVKTVIGWSFVDINGKQIVSQHFGEAKRFSQGFAAVKIGGKYGFIDKKGLVVVKPQFKNALYFTESLCPVEIDSGKWGYADFSGKLKIPAIFDSSDVFHQGLAMVKVGGKCGFIDTSGKFVIEPKYDIACRFNSDRAIAAEKNWNQGSPRGALLSAHLEGFSFRKDSATGEIYIPENLDDALRELDSTLPAKAKKDISIIEKSDMAFYHHGFGTGLRNSWGLWKGKRLAQYFRTLGINHPDDMSGTILDAYWSRVHNIPFDLDGKIAMYKHYWEQSQPVVSVSAKLTPVILNASLADAFDSNQKTSLNQILPTAKLTVLALGTRSDYASPKLLKAFDELRSAYKQDDLNLVFVFSKETVGNAVTQVGRIVDGKLVMGGSDLPASATSFPQYSCESTFFKDVVSNLKMEVLTLPATVLIGRDGTTIKRFNGFDENTKVKLQKEIGQALETKPSK